MTKKTTPLRRFNLVVALLILGIGNLSGQTQGEVIPSAWLTVPEKTNYESTSTYAEVMSQIHLFVKSSPFLRLDTLGFSPEGNVIPLVVVANPMIDTSIDPLLDPRPVLYMQGNIHAGEVEGKEALLMILRDITTGKNKEWFKDRIVLINPIYNSDSNDKMEEGIRPSQEDSPRKVGQRSNSQGLDLNRDGMKAEANETKAALGMIKKWDPDLFVDFHTTNGTWHGYRLTWAPAYQTIGDTTLFNYSWYSMLPDITTKVKQNYDLDFGPYGWYNLRDGWPPKKLETYNHHPRYLVNQMGLRNRMAILSETFAHDRFYIRIQSAYAFANEILNHFAEHGSTIKMLNQAAERKSSQAVGQKLGLRFKKKPLPETFTLRTYDYLPYVDEDGKTSYARIGGIVEYEGVENYSAFEPDLYMEMPKAYFIPESLTSVVDLLHIQGIEMQQLSKSEEITVQPILIKGFEQSPRAFQGHKMAFVSDYEILANEKRSLPSAGFVVEMNQPLSKLAFYLLEALSDDGVLTWNFLDDHLKEASTNSPIRYPILRIVE